jgi:hypothetical protein
MLNTNVQNTLEEFLDHLNDPGDQFYSLCEVNVQNNGTVRVFLNAPIADELIAWVGLGISHVYAENAHTLHVLA